MGGALSCSYCRYPTSEVNERQPILLPLEESSSSSSVSPTDVELPVKAEDTIPTEDSLPITSFVDTLSSEAIDRSSTPPPPTSSPPPLSPVKGDSSSREHAEEWKEPQLDSTANSSCDDDNVDAASCSSLDTDQLSTDIEDIFNDIDHSRLSATITKGLHDSLGTLSNLSKDTMVSIN